MLSVVAIVLCALLGFLIEPIIHNIPCSVCRGTLRRRRAQVSEAGSIH